MIMYNVLFGRVPSRPMESEVHLTVLAVAIKEQLMTAVVMTRTKTRVMTNLLTHTDLKI